MKKFFVAFIILIFYSKNILLAQSNNKPLLVVEIIVEQMRYDQIIKYWNKFGNNGFKKLINYGTFCKNAHYQYLNINSASGIATIACGAYPSQNGIINKKWYNRLTQKNTYCVDDPETKILGTIFGTGKSPKNLKSITWTDQLRIANYKMSKVFSISLNDYSAIIAGGKLANSAYWFNEKNGKWTTSSYYAASLPLWLKQFNSQNFPQIYLDRTWNTLLPISQYTESLSDATEYEIGFNGKHTFPYNLKTLRKTHPDYSLLKYTPYGNTFTKDLAINLMMKEYLGKDPFTDALIIDFAATSYISDIFGLQSIELEDAYIRLDKDISHLISAVESYVGKGKVLFILTSDRGSCENYNWLKDINIKTGIFNPVRASVLLNSYLRAIYGMGNWVDGFHNNEFYLSHFNIDKAKLSLSDIQNKAAELLVNMNGVASIIATSNLKKGTYSSGIMKQAQNSYFSGRSGDLFLVLNYAWRFKNQNKSLSACNSPYNENNHVPIIFYGTNIKHKQIYSKISMDDLATTICFLLNIPLPNKATGNPIEAILTQN